MGSTKMEALNRKYTESEVRAVMNGDTFGGFKVEGISIAGQVINSQKWSFIDIYWQLGTNYPLWYNYYAFSMQLFELYCQLPIL